MPKQAIASTLKACALLAALSVTSTATAFDHSAFNRIVEKYVGPEGGVDYAAIRAEARSSLDAYAKSLRELQPRELESFSRAAKMAFYINAYNALTIKLVVDHYPVPSIRKIPKVSGITTMGQWTKKLLIVAGESVSLNDIEHKFLRPMGDPRIHFVLVCASASCPNLAQEAFTAENLEALLERRTIAFNTSPKGVTVEESAGRPQLRVSAIYDWYQKDFLLGYDDIPSFIARHSDEKTSAFIKKNAKRLKVKQLPYDWSLNDSVSR